MAIARLSMKVGKTGKAAPHAAYIAREGQYASRLDRGERLEATGTGNLPAWASSQPLAFWQAADAHERVNGTTYREMEIALPRELSAAQRADLVRGWVAQELGDTHAYQWAIHVPTAADGGEQPHVHLMFSERRRDGIARDPEVYFKRANKAHPERGGCRKGYGPHAGQTLTRAARATDLKALRRRWEVACNQALEAARCAARIDMRSYAEQGLSAVAERKQLPSQWRGEGKVRVVAFRAAKAEQRDSGRALAQAVPDVRAAVVSLEHAKVRRAVAAMPAAELVARWDTAQATLVRTIQARADGLADRIEQQQRSIQRRRQQAMARHEKQKPAEPQGLLAGLKRKSYEAALAAWKVTAKRISAWKARREADLSRRLRRVVGYMSRRLPHVVDRATGKAQRMLARRMPAHAARLPQARAEVKREQAAQREREQSLAAFEKLALRRGMQMHGYTDTGRHWRAVPDGLRRMVDTFNAIPKAQRAAVLDTMQRDPAKLKNLTAAMQQYEQQRKRQQPAQEQGPRGPSLGR